MPTWDPICFSVPVFLGSGQKEPQPHFTDKGWGVVSSTDGHLAGQKSTEDMVERRLHGKCAGVGGVVACLSRFPEPLSQPQPMAALGWTLQSCP